MNIVEACSYSGSYGIPAIRYSILQMLWRDVRGWFQ